MKKSIYPLTILIISSATDAFVMTNPCESLFSSSPLSLSNHNDDNIDNDFHHDVIQRRTFLRNIASVTFGIGMGMTIDQKPASATYSAYTNREKDWQARKENGEVKYSTARDLKRQLQEVAPMNVSKSQVFCPNGPSAAVSPLMENKCNDQLAMPSVFGRSDDILGNSIPGKNYSSLGGVSALSAADTGGFPSYK